MPEKCIFLNQFCKTINLRNNNKGAKRIGVKHRDIGISQKARVGILVSLFFSSLLLAAQLPCLHVIGVKN